MKANIIDINGKKLKEIVLPNCFSSEIRDDIIAKVLEAKKSKQPYGPSPVAGNQHSASGKIRHRRHVWKTHYGKGISRIPRKIMTKKGSQFIWVGATVPFARGGRRAHPPKVLSMINTKKINKKELNLALISAISATANEKEVQKKYTNLKNSEIKNLPFIIESKIISLKTKELIQSLKKILGNNLFEIISKKETSKKWKRKIKRKKIQNKCRIINCYRKK